MESKPLVSVLMTVYNREKYIAEAIESVLGSTYTNFELIIVDDRSSDKSVKIARTYEKKDERVKVYINEKNLGDYPNRNKAASYAKGKYLKYVDADDMIYPYGLEQLVYYMEQFPEAGYGMCTYPQNKEKIYPFALSSYEAYKMHYFGLKIFDRAPLSTIIKKSAFDELNGFSGKQHLGDFEMWHRLSKRFEVVLMPQGIIWYRVHEEQQMNDNRTDPNVPFKYLLFSEDVIQSDDCPLKKEEVDDIIRSLRKKQAHKVVSALKHNSINTALNLKRKGSVKYFAIFKVLLQSFFK